MKQKQKPLKLHRIYETRNFSVIQAKHMAENLSKVLNTSVFIDTDIHCHRYDSRSDISYTTEVKHAIYRCDLRTHVYKESWAELQREYFILMRNTKTKE